MDRMWGKSRVKVFLCKLKNRDVVAELHTRTLPVAQHESQRGFEHILIGRLASGFFVDREILAGGNGSLFRVSQELLYLSGVDRLLFRRCHSESTQFALRSQCR